MNANDQKPAWRDLAEQASKEPNSRKLFALVEQLCDALDGKVQPKVDPANRADSNSGVA